MAIWLARAGSHGEYEQKFVEDKKIYLTWDALSEDISALDRSGLYQRLSQLYPTTKPRAISNWTGQIWSFTKEMKKGDIVGIPSKSQPVIFFYEVVGDYVHEIKAQHPFYHSRQVKLLAEVPRSHLRQDILYSFGAFLTICRISRNDAEARIERMRNNGWKSESTNSIISQVVSSDEEIEESLNIEEIAAEQISRLIISKFKGHGLTRLVDAILRAQGYTTYLSPEGPDGSVDILAGGGRLGFVEPRLCVQVKSQDNPIELRSITELQGAMTNVKATHGLFVSWNGYKRSVTHSVITAHFFNVRLWTQYDVVRELYANYDRLDEEIKAELPLKRIWIVASQGDKMEDDE